MGIFSLKSGKPKVKKIKEDGCVVTLAIEVPAGEVEEQTQSAFARVQSRARVPGFRAGRAPLDVVKQHFTGHARQEAFDALIRRHVPGAIEELKLRLIETPTVQDVKWKEGEPLILEVQVEVAPTATTKDYLKIPVTRAATTVDDAAIVRRLEELRQANARLEAASEFNVGDAHFAVIDYAASREGKAIAGAKGAAELVDMSAQQNVEGLTPGLKGMARGESKTLKVKLDGKDADLLVTVREIKTKVLPTLDAEFAKDMGCESVDELKAKLKDVMEREAKSRAENEEIRQIEEALIKANRFPLPPSLVERQLEGMLGRLTRQAGGAAKLPEKTVADLRAKLLPKAEDEVRLAFIISAIAEKEKLEASEAELQAELEGSLKDESDESKKKEMREVFDRRKDQIAHMLRERKTMAFLKEKAVYKNA